MGNKGSKGGIIKQRDLKESVDMLVHGYVGNNYDAYVPDSIINIITQFHGIYNINFDSNIIPDNKVLLMEMILCKELNNNDIQLNRIYSGKMDGFTSKIYHQKVDDKGANITIVKNEFNTIFGGYTSLSWGKGNDFHADKDAFLFQLIPDIKIFRNQNPNGDSSICYSNEWFLPNFGDSDLRIRSKCNIDRTSSANPRNFNFENGSQLVGGINDGKEKYFKVIDIEIFTVQCNPKTANNNT